jgi:molybdopterin-guanine dinucleotide biosynthesis protein
MIQAKNMILIGASGRNAGKTTVARALIGAFKSRCDIAVLKITCMAHRHAHCPHGSDGCGACADLKADYELAEEKDRTSGKDTSELLASGAARVFWLRTLYAAIADGYADFASRVSPDMLVICESNSLRKSVVPGCFIMVHNTKHAVLKPTAQDVLALTDISVTISEPRAPDFSGLIARLDIRREANGIAASVLP